MGKIKKSAHERGAVLVLALLISLVMIIFAAPLLFKLSAQYRITDKSFKSLAALNLAEAGIERAIWELNYSDISSWNGDSSLRTLNISSFQTSDGDVLGDIDINISDPAGKFIMMRL